jgi:hypothetical protein
LARLEDSADEWLSAFAAAELGKGNGGGEDEPPPLRLHYPLHYALRTWADYHRHGLMPRPGGYDAQDTAWSVDMDVITKRYNWHVRQLSDEDSDGEQDMETDAFTGAIAGIQQTDWRDVLGE